MPLASPRSPGDQTHLLRGSPEEPQDIALFSSLIYNPLRIRSKNLTAFTDLEVTFTGETLGHRNVCYVTDST